MSSKQSKQSACGGERLQRSPSQVMQILRRCALLACTVVLTAAIVSTASASPRLIRRSPSTPASHAHTKPHGKAIGAGERAYGKQLGTALGRSAAIHPESGVRHARLPRGVRRPHFSHRSRAALRFRDGADYGPVYAGSEFISQGGYGTVNWYWFKFAGRYNGVDYMRYLLIKSTVSGYEMVCGSEYQWTSTAGMYGPVNTC